MRELMETDAALQKDALDVVIISAAHSIAQSGSDEQLLFGFGARGATASSSSPEGRGGATRNNGTLEAFRGEALPRSLHSYVHRILKYARCNHSSAVIGFFYLERIKKLFPEFCFRSHNALKLVIISIMVATKMFEDCHAPTTVWADISELSIKMICDLELRFLGMLDFNTNVQRLEYEDFVDSLASRRFLQDEASAGHGAPYHAGGGRAATLRFSFSELHLSRCHTDLWGSVSRRCSESCLSCQATAVRGDDISGMGSDPSDMGADHRLSQLSLCRPKKTPSWDVPDFDADSAASAAATAGTQLGRNQTKTHIFLPAIRSTTKAFRKFMMNTAKQSSSKPEGPKL